MAQKLNVAVTGVGGGVGQSVIRALRLSAVPVHIVGLDADPWAVGLYQCDAHEVIPLVSDLATYQSAIERVVAKHRLRALIPGTDTELRAIAEMREHLLSRGCTAIVSSPDFVSIARDKLLSYQTLRQAGIPFVRTLGAADFLSSYHSASYPVIAKPKGGSASVGARVLHGPSDVERTELGDDDIVQDYLLPTSWNLATVAQADVMKLGRLRQEDEVSVQAVIAPNGEIVSIFASINELRDGVPTRVCPTLDEHIVGFGRGVFEAFVRMGHGGPCNFQGRLTDAGILVYEVNPRFTGITVVRAAMGWNEVEAALRLFVLGEPADSVGARLSYNTDTICLRYITEEFVPLGAIERASGRG
ncbi:MAG: ATP-grasp domain-containing protein [Armatimonadota bacterium]